MAAEDGEISDGELESSEDEGVALGPNEKTKNKKQFLSQQSAPYTMFSSKRVHKGTRIQQIIIKP